MISPGIIIHVAQPAALSEGNHDTDDRADYSCDSLASEGFIHCCTREQLEGVLTRYFDGADTVRLLLIDTRQLVSELVFENTVGGKELFPHVYGPINSESIVRSLNLETGDISRFLSTGFLPGE